MDRVGTLEIETDDALQRVVWRVERVAWVCFGVLIVCAGLGLLGGAGPLSRSRAEAGGVSIDYRRFERMQSPVTLRFIADIAHGTRPTIVVRKGFLERATIERITPEPEASRAVEGGVELLFLPVEGGRFAATLDAEFRRAGVVQSGFQVNGTSLEFTQVVYP